MSLLQCPNCDAVVGRGECKRWGVDNLRCPECGTSASEDEWSNADDREDDEPW